MSISSNELNYLIWRYLQEGGLEVSAYALQDETRVHDFDEKYEGRIPLGCLVDLVQKGILYSKVNDMVNEGTKQLGDIDTYVNGFNLFEALEEAKKNNPQLASNGVVEATPPPENGKTIAAVPHEEEEEFISVLKELFKFPEAVSSDWNPAAPSVLAWGQMHSRAQICALGEGKFDEIALAHPFLEKEITAVAWNPQGSLLVTCMENGEMRIWTADGKLANLLNLHTAPILTVRWNKNGSFILSSDVDNKTIIWDAATGKALQFVNNATIFNDQGVNTQQVSKTSNLGIDAFWIDNTKFVIPGLKGAILIYALGEKIPVGMLEGHSDIVSCISYDRDLHLLASGSDDNTIRIWKGNSYNSSQILTGHSQPITSVNWLQVKDLPPLVISTSLDGTVKIWNVLNGDVLLSSISENGFPILEGKVSPDMAKFVLGDTEGNVQLFDISAARLTALVQAKTSSIKPKAMFQVFTSDKVYISQIAWSCDSSKISVCVSGSESYIISI